MDAAKALAELIEVSSQIESAVIADDQDNVIAATPADAVALAAAGRALLEQAREARGREPAQLAASTPRGSVFVVRGPGRTIVATTTPDPVAGLIFYDLKNCLGNAA